MAIIEAPRCILCDRIYVEGQAGVCSACLRAKRKGNQNRRNIPVPCDCGEKAVTVILVRVGTTEDGFSTVRMPLCVNCLKIEKEINAALGG